MSKEQWRKFKEEEKKKNAGKNLGAVGITSFKSRSFMDWQKSGGKNLFPVDPKKVKDPKEIPYMYVVVLHYGHQAVMYCVVDEHDVCAFAHSVCFVIWMNCRQRPGGMPDDSDLKPKKGGLFDGLFGKK